MKSETFTLFLKNLAQGDSPWASGLNLAVYSPWAPKEALGVSQIHNPLG